MILMSVLGNLEGDEMSKYTTFEEFCNTENVNANMSYGRDTVSKLLVKRSNNEFFIC